MNDSRLLRQYVVENSQAAFAQLTDRYVGLVYSASLREVRDPQLAEDVTQAVFLLLARKASALSQRVDLAGWLFHASRLTAKNLLRQEARRTRHEQELVRHVAHLEADQAGVERLWTELEPDLNEALARLASKERDAILLRFFVGMTLRETGAALGLTEDATRMRVARGLERLRRHLATEGLAISAALLGSVFAAKASQAAPVNCHAAVAKLAANLATGNLTTAALAPKLFSVTEGVWKTMWITKIKTTVALATACLTIGGTAVGLIRLRAMPTGAATSKPLRLTDASLSAGFKDHPVIVVDAGHGGRDYGCVGLGGEKEKDLNLAVATALRAELERRGAEVYMTREGDTFPTMTERVHFAAQCHANYFLSIHCEVSRGRPGFSQSSPGASQIGTEVYYHAREMADRRLAADMIRVIGSRLPAPVQSDTARFPAGFYVLRAQTIPAVLVECGQLDDANDLARLESRQEQQRLASGIADGLVAFRIRIAGS